MIKTVVKRNGKEVPFDLVRIKTAIKKADSSTDTINISDRDIDLVTNMAVEYFEDNTKVSVEEIQDAVEDSLIAAGFTQTAKNYIRYRQTRKDRREASKHLMESYSELLFADAEDVDLKRDNANINTDAPMGIMLKLGTEGAKAWALNYGMPERFAEAHESHALHYHDLDFSFITLNCLQQDLGKTLKNGFNTGHGFLREPNSIRAAASLACIAIQSSQNDCFGG